MNPKLSVVLSTRNEEKSLSNCLTSIKHIAWEIVVVDEGSTDSTVKIAKDFAAKIKLVKHSDNFHITKNIAIDSARGDWILQLDADEVVTPELAAEIVKTISSNPPENGFWINRKNWFLTRFLTKGGQYPDPTLRLYRRGKGRLPAKDVHEQAIVEGSIGHLHQDLLHYRDLTFSKYFEGFDRYSSFMALQLKDKATPIAIGQFINYFFLKPLSAFFLIYVRHRGYVDGVPGFIFALFSGLIHPISYTKYWQMTKYPDEKS